MKEQENLYRVTDGSMIEKNNHWDDRARLIQSAKNYPSAKEFINETGWEDWMYDVVDCPDDEDLTDSQIEKINSILYEIYEEANN